MLPYAAYKYVQKKKEKNQREMDDALGSLTSNLTRSLVPDKEIIRVPSVAAKLGEEGDIIPGALTVVEKVTGVFIEWNPSDDESSSTGWVLTGDSDESLSKSPSLSPEKAGLDNAKLRFSIDVNDLSSFHNVEPKKGQGKPIIQFICKDGSSYLPLMFSDSTSTFLDILQRYIILRRSAREPNLVLVVNEKADALAKSVTMLDQNGDILSRLMTNPYATALTQLGKITSFMNDQLIPALLDSDEVSQEEKIRAMRELRLKDDDDNNGLRVHSDVEFEVVTQLDLPPRPEIYREQAVNQQLWNQFKLTDGTFDMQKLHHLKMNVFRGGIVPELRKEAWKYLLEYRKWDEKQSDFEKRRSALTKQYEVMKGQWQSISQEQEDRFFSFSKRKGLVEKDVARTDRTMNFFEGDGNQNLQMLHNILMTYVMYNFDLGYVQGMSDFASPLLYVMENEVDAFWCFVNLMNIIHRNFEKDQANIKMQMNQLRDLVMIVNPRLANYLESHQSDDMYFCFRWVLVWFKREFSFMDTCKLWEVIWTGQPCRNFLLLFCVAILDSQANTIIDNKFGLTEILKHVNDLSMHLKLDDVLTSAEAIFHQLSASQDKLPTHICGYLKLGESALEE